MRLSVWVVWSVNGKMGKRRVLGRRRQTPLEKRWVEAARQAQEDFVKGIRR